MTNAPDDFDRPRGVLTPRDRRFLVGELDDELNDNERRQKRYRLRKRMAHALQDLAYLEWMDTRDVGQMMEGLEDDLWKNPPGEGGGVDEAPILGKTGRLLFTAFDEVVSLSREIQSLEAFKFGMKRQIATGEALDHYQKTGRFAKVTVGIEVTHTEEMSVKELAERAAPGGKGTILLSPYFGPPGGYEVLDLYPDTDLPAVLPAPGERSDSSDAQYTEEYRADEEVVKNIPVGAGVVEHVPEIIKELGARGGVAPRRGRVERLLAETENVSRTEAIDAVRGALLSGLCYQPTDARIQAI